MRPGHPVQQPPSQGAQWNRSLPGRSCLALESPASRPGRPPPDPGSPASRNGGRGPDGEVRTAGRCGRPEPGFRPGRGRGPVPFRHPGSRCPDTSCPEPPGRRSDVTGGRGKDGIALAAPGPAADGSTASEMAALYSPSVIAAPIRQSRFGAEAAWGDAFGSPSRCQGGSRDPGGARVSGVRPWTCALEAFLPRAVSRNDRPPGAAPGRIRPRSFSRAVLGGRRGAFLRRSRRLPQPVPAGAGALAVLAAQASALELSGEHDACQGRASCPPSGPGGAWRMPSQDRLFPYALMLLT